MNFNMLEAHEKHRRVLNIKRGCRNSAASQTEDKVTEKVALFFCKKDKSMV